MTEPFVFNVGGTPRPQPRPRRVKGRFVSTVGPKVKLWKAGVERAAKEAVAARGDRPPLFKGAVRVQLVFTFAPPASKQDRIGEPHAHKPDADNLSKLILDVMKAAGVFGDDSQVAQAPPEKWWGSNPGVSVVVTSLAGVRREEPLATLGGPPSWLRA